MVMKDSGELLDLLRKRCEGKGAASVFARQAGVSETLVSLALSGKQKIGPKIARGLGYRRIVRWTPLQDD
jgi:hypothetical protein